MENKRLTLKDIEKHLKCQDRQTKRMVYFAGATWSASITIAALLLWIGELSGVIFHINRIFFILAGLAFFCYCWRKVRKDSG